MSQIEEAKSGWPPHDPIAHLAPHAPIQAQPETSQGPFHVIQHANWRLQVESQLGNLLNRPPLFGAEWRAPIDWPGNNNKMGEWEKWKAVASTDAARPSGTFGNPSLSALVSTTTPESTESKTEQAQQPTAEVVAAPKEEGTKSSSNTNSYDISASQSPEHDAEKLANGKINKTEQIAKVSSEKQKDEPMDQSEAPAKEIKEETHDEPEKMDTSGSEGSQLLIDFSKRSFSEILDSSNFKKPNSDIPTSSTDKLTEEITKPPVQKGFLHSGTSAFSNIGPNSSAANREPARPASTSNIEVSQNNNQSSTSFCRPPGLGPVALPPTANGQAQPLVCPICGFSCPSKFHYNSHMNTHGDHQCSMCDYTSRTEGRLKKHMRESHTVEEQLKAGLEIDPKVDNTIQTSPTERDIPSSSDISSNNFMMSLSTTMASILDSTASALAASMASSETPSVIPTTLKLDMSSAPNLLNTLAQGTLTSSALDQIRAFTENNSLMPEGGMNLATALGAVSQAINGDPKSPEKISGETRRSSSGKVKILKCKQCGHQSMSKDDQWLHARTHIPSEKQLNCQHCNFVTEYKHHLEYHYRNHMGSKPFHCKKCSYTCVNKSMLNSHMKSHTNHYQFRCVDCTYATKYCHSLKLHLKKYNHRRFLEGNESPESDVSPNLGIAEPIPTFPNMNLEKKFEQPHPTLGAFSFSPLINSQSLNYASQLLLKQHQVESLNPILSSLQAMNLPKVEKCPICEAQFPNNDEQMQHNLSHLINELPKGLLTAPAAPVPVYENNALASNSTDLARSAMATVHPSLETEASLDVDDETTDDDHHEREVKHEDLGNSADDEMDSDGGVSPTEIKRPIVIVDEEARKRRIAELQQIASRPQRKSPSSSDTTEEKDEDSHIESSVSPVDRSNEPSNSSGFRLPAPIPLSFPNNVSINPSSIPSSSALPIAPIGSIESAALAFIQQALAMNASQQQITEANKHMCPHCKMAFNDLSLFRVHMGYHGYDNVFNCNRCDFKSNDSLSFNLHLIHTPHHDTE